MHRTVPRKLLIILALGAAGLVGFVWLQSRGLTPPPQSGASRLEIVEQRAGGKSVAAPPPLEQREATYDAGIVLTESGVRSWTNKHRAEYGLSALTENELLNRAAQLKLLDMFERQYFAHDAPDGTMGAAKLANTVEYQYVRIGENLALGNFADDETLVQAWMDSPGHRANILNAGYEEIGVAVGRGAYQNRSTWIAVQIFGLSQIACPPPDEELASDIDRAREEITRREGELAELWEGIQRSAPRRGPERQRRIEAYNMLVAEFNALLEETQQIIEAHNTRVREFNACIEP